MMSPSLLLLVALTFILGFKAKQRNDGSLDELMSVSNNKSLSFFPV